MPSLASARWLFSTNAKDIGTLYLMLGLFTGLLGTAFSILIRLELSAPGSQFLAGNHQLFNVMTTTHGIMMIRHPPPRPSPNRSLLPLPS
jgi:cytochrome c oxidase subunit 1